MKKSLNYRFLSVFGIMLGLFFSLPAHAEFNTIAINDTMVGPGASVYDIDGDGNNDYRIEIIEVEPNIHIATVTSLGLSSFMDSGMSGFPDALNYGSPVQAPFISGSGILGYTDESGKFTGAGKKYLGLLINASSGYHYGWLELDLNRFNDKLIIGEAGYNTNPGEQILAGATNDNVSIDEYEAPAFSCYPNPCTTELNIKITGQLTQPMIVLYNQNGAEIVRQQNTSPIDVSELPKGVYFLQIQSAELNETRKVIVR